MILEILKKYIYFGFYRREERKSKFYATRLTFAGAKANYRVGAFDRTFPNPR